MKTKTNNKLNVVNRSVFIADNLPVLEGINSRSVDLIYLDPPFNSNKNYSAPIESEAAKASFKDAWTLDDIDLAWVGQIAEKYPAVAAVINAIGHSGGKGDKSYIIFMARRLLEMHRILKDTGSIYLHVDTTMSHSLKMIMDAIFGKKNFRNEIVWCYKGMPSKAKKFQQKHDVILLYGKSENSLFNVLLGEPTPESVKTFASGMRKGYNANNSKKMVTVFNWDKYNAAVASGKIPANLSPKEFTGGKPPMADWWSDIKILGGPNNQERTGYPTQKPLSLLYRIIKASSKEGDVVLDPFCGCATACVAAEVLEREWVGIDISAMAKKLVESRLKKAKAHVFAIDPDKKVKIYTSPPKRTDEEETTVNRKENKHALFGEQDGKCAGCKIQFPFRNLTVDHIIPQVKQGSDKKENLQLLCQACNSTKGKKPMSYLIERLINQGITTPADYL